MPHVQHIAKNKRNLELRAHIIRLIREFFWTQGFLEMETPIVLRLPGQEPYLNPMRMRAHNERGDEFTGYLHTSPEYTLKKMLAAGFEKIFSVCKVFRDRESFGGTHNPEFTMLEWYRSHATMFDIMQDCEELWRFLVENLKKLETRNLKLIGDAGLGSSFQFPVSNFERLHMREAWQKYAGVNLDEYLTREAMLRLCREKGYIQDVQPRHSGAEPRTEPYHGSGAWEPYDDLFYRIFLNEIEPHLGKERPTIIHHYPKPMAALCRMSETEPDYAERFELYVNGLELANAFGELTDKEEQSRRLEADREQRELMGKEVFDVDMEFVEAVGMMPPSGGIALGVDRLAQLFTGCKNIDDVLVLPASLLFGEE